MHIRTNKTLNILLHPLVWAAEWMGVHHPLTLMRLRYFARFHRPLRINPPRTLNEVIIFLSLKTDTSLWTLCSDKYRVREYVKQCGLENILVKLYGVWQKAEDIDFDSLPDRFVLKGNHGCGDILLVNAKNQIDKDAVVKTYSRDLRKRYGAIEAGLHYLRIEPCVIAEELLEIDEETKKYSSVLIDYKIWCFNGKPHFVWICNNRHGEHKEVMLYDTEWNMHPEYLIYDSEYVEGAPIPKPNNLEEMLDVAAKLSEPFPEVRCDLYNTDGRIYFGELTFTGYGGLMTHYTEDFQQLAGSLIDLSSVKIIER